MPVLDRLRSMWNAFTAPPETIQNQPDYPGFPGSSASYGSISPSRPRLRYANDRSIVASVYNRISMDVADIPFRHTLTDVNGLYDSDVDSNLNSCLTLEPNVDQGPRHFLQDAVMTLFDKGVVALVPVDTSVDPNTQEVVDIYTLRVGEIVAWYPSQVRVLVYNEDTGNRQEVTLAKRYVTIIENPFFTVMNQPNSTQQRLIRKLNLLDTVDDQTSSGKLDIIIQLPYAVRSEARKVQAQQRRDDIEFQLKGSQYGIAYADATEKITQLNRPSTNNLLDQVTYLIAMLYGQLGITPEVMNGTADAVTMNNYFQRAIKPIAEAFREGMQRAFLGHQGTAKFERIMYFRDVFKFMVISDLAEVVDKFTRNEIATSNEMRTVIGWKPSTDPKANELRNSNLPRSDTEIGAVQLEGTVTPAPPAPPNTAT